MRTISQIATEIKQLWRKPYFGAVPYLDAMLQINSEKRSTPYMFEDAGSIVDYFLANATYWRGEDARRIKNELKNLPE